MEYDECMPTSLLPVSGGTLLVSVQPDCVMALARVLTLSPGDDMRPTVNEGGIYVVAFRSYPNDLHAIRVPAGWTGQQQLDGRHSITREEAAAAVGADVLDIACDAVGEIAVRLFASWQDDNEKRVASVRALLNSTPPAEA